MGILVICILTFVLICIAMEVFDEHKEKIFAKLQICKKNSDSLSRKTKSMSKELKKKIVFIGVGFIIIVIIGISAYIGISNYIKEKQRLEKYNNDITNCYETIKNDYNWSNFKSIVSNHEEESDFEHKAYEKLYQAIDERIDNIKNGNEDNKLITMLESIKKDKTFNSVSKAILEKIESKYLIANSYTNINTANKQIAEQKFKEAYELLETVITSNKEKNQDIVEIATNKQNEIKEKALEQVITQAQEKVNSQDYSSVQTMLSKYKDLGNQTILDMYNNATNEVNRIEAEKKAQEELERRKQQEEERKRQQEELNAKKDKIIVDTNGKRIYKVCMYSNTFSISGNFTGQGHFSVELLDSNQDLYKLMVNEIGDYVVNKSVSVTKGAYYYLQIECTRGSWNLNWTGTYGD